MIRRLFITLFTLGIFLIPTHAALAAKQRVTKKNSAPVVAARGYSSARLSRATNSVVVTFLNLSRVKKVSYELSYSAQGIAQGAIGSLLSAGKSSESRDLYFGTCSHGVCTPHYGISNAVLTVTVQLTSGGANTKRYRIKV